MHPPHSCPACRGPLAITTLSCSGCGTRVEGRFELCPFCRLNPEDRTILETYIRNRGNIRELQRELGTSYPTARSRIEQVWECLGYSPATREERETASEILERLRQGEIDVNEAAVRLRHRQTPPPGDRP